MSRTEDPGLRFYNSSQTCVNCWTSKIRRKLNRCPNCDEVNPHDFDHCGRCGHALTIEGKTETSNVKDMLATLMQDPESVRIFQQKLMSASF